MNFTTFTSTLTLVLCSSMILHCMENDQWDPQHNVDKHKIQLVLDNGFSWYLVMRKFPPHFIDKNKITDKIINYTKSHFFTPQAIAFLQSHRTSPHTIFKKPLFVPDEISFTHDGTQVRCHYFSERIEACDLQTGNHIETLNCIPHNILSYDDNIFSYNKRNKIAHYHSLKGNLHLWNLTTGESLKTLETRDISHVNCVAINHNNTLLASGSVNGTIRLWDTIAGECSKILRGHTNEIKSIAFNHDGTQLASSSRDGTIRVWDLKKFNKSKENQFTLEETVLLAKYAKTKGKDLTQSQENKLTQMRFKLT